MNDTLVPMSVEKWIESHVHRGKLETEERRQDHEFMLQQEAAQEAARLEELWKPIVEQVRNGIPPWAHPYLEWDPTQEPSYVGRDYDRFYQPVRIQLVGCVPIEAFWYDSKNWPTHKGLYFRVCEPQLRHDDEVGWHIRTQGPRASEYDVRHMETSFDVALYTAHRHGKTLERLQAECEQNRMESTRRTPPPAAPPKPVDILRKYAGFLRELETTFTPGQVATNEDAQRIVDATGFWAMITQAEALHQIAKSITHYVENHA